MLVLDEPTSAMDTQTEKALIGRLGQYLEGRSMLLVTHRASLLAFATRVIILDHGRIVADGPREEVLSSLASGAIKGNNPRVES